MNIQLRLSQNLRKQMQSDLLRPHSFAAERVGFARLAPATVDGGSLLLLNSYWGVPDNQYIDDQEVGARIDGTAIRHAMQEVLTGGHGLFHVHMHDRKGPTRLSKTDAAEIPKLVASFRNVGPQFPHGFLILTPNQALAYVSLPGATGFEEVKKISFVGYPTEVLT